MQTLKYIFLSISLFGITILNAQNDKPEAFWNKGIVKDFKRIQTETEAYYKNRDKGKGSGYKQWKRWEYNQQDRLAPNGEITNYNARNGNALQEYLRENPVNNRMSLNTWTQWGQNLSQPQTPFPDGVPGTGVLNCIAFDNDDPNIIYTGGPACGLWRTLNGGTSWTNLTDNANNAIIGISSIAVNHMNDNIIYILTGDGDGRDSPSIGVFKSTNFGATWQPTGLTWDLDEVKYGYKMAMNPVNPDILIVATANNGLYRTINGGATWTNHESGTFYDVTWKPGSASIVYASNTNSVFKSTDAGVTWTSVAYLPNSERVQIGVTPNDPNYVFALGSGFVNQGGNPGFPGFIRSTNSGSNWGLMSNTPAICSVESGVNNNVQATYNIDFAVKPNSTNTIITGAINVYKSTNDGILWDRRTLWYDDFPLEEYVHADVHGIEYNPLNNKLYIVCDGGIYLSNDDAGTFQDITSNMQLNAFFDFAGTPQNSNFMVGGLYHNGSRIFTGVDTTKQIGDGDGAGCMIDPTNMNTLYLSAQNGLVNISTNTGETYSSIKPSPASGPFITKMALNHINSNEIFVGWTNDTIYRSANYGSSYTYSVLPDDFLYNGTPGDVKHIEVSAIPSIVYACTDETVFRSTDFGVTWTNIYYSGEDFTRVVAITPSLAIITRGGYDDGEKVYLYDADDDSATNISNNLPNVPVWTSVYNPNNVIGEIYVGTDLGVYKSEFPYTSWTLFGTNFVNLPIVDLVIYPTQSKIRAATYGRGLLEATLNCQDVLNLTQANDPNYGTPIFESNQATFFMDVSRNVIGNNGDVTYKAGLAVILQNGFLATEGNKVIVKTADCGVE